jgi:hypothetical protein
MIRQFRTGYFPWAATLALLACLTAAPAVLAQPPQPIPVPPQPVPKSKPAQWRPGIHYNAVVRGTGEVLPVYPVHDPGAKITGVAFRYDGDVLTAFDPIEELWSRKVGKGQVFGGFDYNQDGWIDLAVARSQEIDERCGDVAMNVSWVELIDGKTGEPAGFKTPQAKSLCWDFRTPTDRDPKKVYPTTQWTNLSVLFGAGTRTLALLPYYAEDGQFLTWQGPPGTFEQTKFLYPSTPRFDALYKGAVRPNPFSGQTGFVKDAHVANGMMVTTPAGPRLVFFTSGRVVQYAVAPFGPGQLVADRPLLSGGRKELAGRNYGLVTREGGGPLVVLIGGTNAYSLFADMRTGKMETDPWGQLERHIAIYNLQSNQIDDRFFSYALDNNGAAKYEGRVAYPNGCLLAAGPGLPSRLGYNVYQKGHWYFHVSRPGSTADAQVFRDLFVWDIRDLDHDGRQEIIASPSRYDSDPDVPGYYFVKRETWILTWDDAAERLATQKTYPGVIPYLKESFRAPTTTTSMGYLYPVLTTVEDGRLMLLGLDGKNGIALLKI